MGAVTNKPWMAPHELGGHILHSTLYRVVMMGMMEAFDSSNKVYHLYGREGWGQLGSSSLLLRGVVFIRGEERGKEATSAAAVLGPKTATTHFSNVSRLGHVSFSHMRWNPKSRTSCPWESILLSVYCTSLNQMLKYA